MISVSNDTCYDLCSMYLGKFYQPCHLTSPVGALDHGAGGRRQDVIRVGGQAPAQEGRAEVDGDGGEPDHEQREHAALARVRVEEADVLGAVLGHYRGAVENRGEETNLV